jgi:hypothetical protein
MTVIYDLVCDAHHRFEGWFRSAEHYVEQADGGLVTCPQCGSSGVRKLPTASRVNTLVPVKDSGRSSEDDDAQARVAKLYDYIERNFDDVGTRFAEEARKMHYGEAEERQIRGQATAVEIKGLLEEGVSALPLPLPKSKLN